MPDKQLKAEHTPEAIRHRLREGYRHNYLKDFIYGAIDGAVTTFAVVSGVAGAALSIKVVIILGMANLLGDGFSMAVGNYLGTKAEEELREKARRIEQNHIETIPDGEKEEIRQIFADKGFKGADLEKAVKIITSDPRQWVDTMLREELGLSLEGASPVKAALLTFSAFVLVGAIPLLAFFYHLAVPGVSLDPFRVSVVLTLAAFFAVGAFKGRFVEKKWYLSGLETLVVGSAAAFIAFAVGVFLKNVV